MSDRDPNDLLGPDEDFDVDAVYEALDDTEFEDVVLTFVDDEEQFDYSDALAAATDVLGEYTLDEIIDFNETSPQETLALMFYRGDIGLPLALEDDPDSEEEPDIQETEEE